MRIVSCHFSLSNCLCFACIVCGVGNGAGVSIQTAPDIADVECPDPPSYYPYDAVTLLSISNATIVGNHADCLTCSGGGVSVGVGGQLSVTGSVIANNTAGVFGGGLLLGVVQQSTCGLAVADSVIDGNTASHGGSQLYSTCAAGVSVVNVVARLGTGDSQVGADAVHSLAHAHSLPHPQTHS